MTYTLHHGDCLDVLPTLAPGSVDAVIVLPRGGVIIPFAFYVAHMAKTNQIAQLIRLFPNVKAGEPNDMVNVELFAKFAFGNSALLAGVIVTLACQSPLSLPVGAVIVDIPAAPVRMINSAVPNVSAVGRTEAESACSLERGGDDNMLSATLAIVFGDGLLRWFRGQKSIPSRSIVALARAYDHELSTHLKRFTFKHIAANLARMRVVIRILFPSQLIGAFTAASGLPSPFEALRVGKIGLVTDRACAFNHVHDYSMTVG